MSEAQHDDRERARSAHGEELDALLHHKSAQVLEALLENPGISEAHLLILLSRRDLSREIVSRIAKKQEWVKSYAVKLAILRHPKTARHIAFPLLKFVYIFDLMAMATDPGVPPEMKRLAEEMVLTQSGALALGQRLTLARRGSPRIAGGFLLDQEPSVIRAALANAAMTEKSVAAALLTEKASSELTLAVDGHPRWATRHLVKLALVRSRHISLGRFVAILQELALGDLLDLAEDRRVPERTRNYVAKIAKLKQLQNGKLR